MKLTVVEVPEDIEVREGTTKALACTEKTCGERPLPLIVKERNDEGEMAVEKGKKWVVPNTELPVADSGVRIRGLGPEDVVRVNIDGADAEAGVRV